MKKLLTLRVCTIFVAFSFAQKLKDETPAAVKAAFAAKYPTAKKVKWSVEKPGEFEVDFTLNKVESSELYDAAGKLLETEAEVNEAELPQAVKTTIVNDFAGFKLDEIEKTTDANGLITYEMEAVKGKEKLEIRFDANGKLLSREPLKEEKDKEEKE